MASLLATLLYGFILSHVQAIEPIVNCSGQYYIATQSKPLNHTSIICNPSTPNCYIICPFREACAYANISCSSINCNIQCMDWSSCLNSIIDGNSSPISSNISLNTASTQNDADYHLGIICDDSIACRHSKIICPINNRCDIICSGTMSCADITISPPGNKSLFNLIWNGSTSLAGVNFPIYPLNDHQIYSLSCNEHKQCNGLNLMCPQYSDCYIHCTCDWACYNVCGLSLNKNILLQSIYIDGHYMAN